MNHVRKPIPAKEKHTKFNVPFEQDFNTLILITTTHKNPYRGENNISTARRTAYTTPRKRLRHYKKIACLSDFQLEAGSASMVE